MKNFAIILAILSLTSCGFYKRQYTNGWMLSHRNASHNNKLVYDTPPSNVNAAVDNTNPVIDQHAIIDQHTLETDTITPENQSTPRANAIPERKEEEQDFFTPKEGYNHNNQNPNQNFNEELIKKTFDNRTKKASLGLKMMLIGFACMIIGLALEMNGAANPELWMAISVIGIIAALVSFVYMFYFTYKSFEIQNNNPHVIFDRQSKSQLIFPAVFSILFSGWIGLIFALVLVIKNSKRRNKK
jgi:hypothetical protein